MNLSITYEVVRVVNNSSEVSPLDVIQLVNLLNRLVGHLW